MNKPFVEISPKASSHMLDFLQKHEGLEGHEVHKGYEGQESHGTWHIINYNVGASRGPLDAILISTAHSPHIAWSVQNHSMVISKA